MMRPVHALVQAGWLLAFALVCGPALAHKGSDAYLDVQQLAPANLPGSTPAAASARAAGDFTFSLAVAIRDLDLVVPIDANADARVTWGEARAATPRVLALLNQTATLDVPPGAPAMAGPGPGECRLDWQADGLERRSDGVYFRAVAHTRGDAAGVTAGGPQAQAGLAGGQWSALRDYFSLGMHHLLQGYDHLAFLLALVLPLQLSLRRRPQTALTHARPAGAAVVLPGAAPAYATRSAWLALLRTVTAFTLGHSITLMLATFGWTQASPVWVEPVIALSIVITALLNLRPVRWIRMDVLALLFGLVHGFGFAGLLLEAAAPGGLLPWALAGFNLGVEAGQLTAVLGWVLVSQALVGRRWYASVVVRGGSALLVLLAAWWFWQRVG